MLGMQLDAVVVECGDRKELPSDGLIGDLAEIRPLPKSGEIPPYRSLILGVCLEPQAHVNRMLDMASRDCLTGCVASYTCLGWPRQSFQVEDLGSASMIRVNYRQPELARCSLATAENQLRAESIQDNTAMSELQRYPGQEPQVGTYAPVTGYHQTSCCQRV